MKDKQVISFSICFGNSFLRNSYLSENVVGECMLENMRTLCVACHYDVTKAQCADRRLARAKAKKQLKAAMDSLKNAQNNEQTDTNIKVCSQS